MIAQRSPAASGSRTASAGPALDALRRPWSFTETVTPADDVPTWNGRTLYELLDAVRPHVGSDRVRQCGNHVVASADEVTCHVDPAGRPFVRNVIRCGMIWMCPVCSARERMKRQERARLAGKAHTAKGHTILFLTVTIPHRHDEPGGLDHLLNGVLLKAWRRMQQGKTWQRKRDEYGGWSVMRAIEITHGQNSWHPHLHAAIAVEKDLTTAEVEHLEKWMRARWIDRVSKLHRAPNAHGLKLVRVPPEDVEDVLSYSTKLESAGFWAEVVSGPGKSRSFIDLVSAVADGDRQAVGLLREYETATRGKNMLVFGPGFELEPDDSGDDDAASVVDDAEVEENVRQAILDGNTDQPEDFVCWFDRYEWDQIAKGRHVGGLMRAIAGGIHEVSLFMIESGLRICPRTWAEYVERVETRERMSKQVITWAMFDQLVNSA